MIFAPSQIPVTTTEEELRGIFAPYGTIVELALLKKNPGAGQAVGPGIFPKAAWVGAIICPTHLLHNSESALKCLFCFL